MGQEFIWGQIIIAIVTMLASPLIGRLLESVWLLIVQWLSKDRPKSDQELSTEALLRRLGQRDAGLRQGLIRIRQEWDSMTIRLDFQKNKIDTDCWMRGSRLLQNADKYIHNAENDQELDWLDAAKDAIAEVNRILVEEDKRNNSKRAGAVYVIGPISAMIVATVSIVVLTTLVPNITSWKLLDLVPLYIIFFSVFGSCSSALYTFMNEFNKERDSINNVRNYIVSPVFGFGSGMLLYLAVSGGLTIFGGRAIDKTNAPLLAVIAFIGGFFAERTIYMVSGVKLTNRHLPLNNLSQRPQQNERNTFQGEEQVNRRNTNNENGELR